MTNNIVAQFASSVWKSSESERAHRLGFLVGDFKEYVAVNGSIFNEEYNETLDSGSLVLSQIPLADRLINMKPYDYVRIYDKSGNTNYDKILLVDNFQEKENNIKEHIFGYTIHLMSETKILEKIQCPNLTQTHEVKNGKSTAKTIYQYIKQYMELYIPKIKFSNGTNWSYEPLISCPNEYSDFAQRFDVPCADMGSSAYTMRQLLTMLMQQVGCIPVVRNRVLGFLDFQKQGVDFAKNFNGDYSLGNTVNFIHRSLSSDSYVNTLVNISENVLDSENEVIAETVCFRDKNNVLLRQRENLYLETSFPIYKINECIMHMPGQYSGYISSSKGCFVPGFNTPNFAYPFIYYRNNTIAGSTAHVQFSCSYIVNLSHTVQIFNNLIYFFGRRPNGSYYLLGSKPFADFVMDSSTTQQSIIEWYPSHDTITQDISFDFTDIPAGTVGFCFSGTFVSGGSSRTFSFVKFDDSDPNIRYWTPNATEETTTYLERAAVAAYNLNVAGTRTWDITKLVVENSVRQLLDRDFTKMMGTSGSGYTDGEMSSSDSWTIDNLSKYVYGTVGYSIGSNRISGFSDVFYVGSQTSLGWITKDYSYIENMINFLKHNFDYENDLLYEQFEFLKYIGISMSYSNSTVGFPSILSYGTIINYDFNYYAPTENDFLDKPFFTSCFFDLKYQPLNSFNLAYVKSVEDVDIPLAQYDGNSSGLTDFDRLSTHEQEQVDRLGNETLFISQRTDNFADIQTFDEGPLIFKEDTDRSGSVGEEDNGVDYVIFKRSFTINNNCFNVSYVGAKDAVLKDYFTSIRTKYRAYQYVDYNASVLRKERDTLYVRISQTYYDGDDKIWLGSYLNERPANIKYWIYDITNSASKDNTISYECERDVALVSDGLEGSKTQLQTIKNSVSLITTSNMWGVIYEYVDNVGAGPYITNITNDENLGGVPESWHIWDERYKTAHTVTYVNYIDFYSSSITESGDVNVIKNNVAKWERSPIVDDSFINLNASNHVVFSVVDNNKPTTPVQNRSYADFQRTFYKDEAERINHTVQFIYYAPDKDVLFNENFISGTPMIARFPHEFNYILGADEVIDTDGRNHFRVGKEKMDFIFPLSERWLTNRDTSSFFNVEEENIDSVMPLNPLLPSTSPCIVIWKYVIPNSIATNFKIENIEVFPNDGSVIIQGFSYFEDTQTVTITAYAQNEASARDAYFRVSYSYSWNPNFYQGYVELIGDNVLRIYWHDERIIRLCSKDTTNWYDIAVFKCTDKVIPEYTDYYFMINDTKTDYVLSEKNGVLYRKYKVATNTLDRTVIDNPDIYNSED